MANRKIKHGSSEEGKLPKHTHAVNEVAASLAMSGMPLTESEKDDLEEFEKMTKEEQESNIKELASKYKAMGMKDQSSALADVVEKKLDEADAASEKTDVRLSHSEVFSNLKNRTKTDKNENSDAIISALHKLQEEMAGEAEKAGFRSDEDVAEFIMKLRHEENENVFSEKDH